MKIKCLFGYHDYKLVQELGYRSRQIWCPRCKKRFAMNDDIRCLVEWDSDFDEMYSVVFGIKVIDPR